MHFSPLLLTSAVVLISAVVSFQISTTQGERGLPGQGQNGSSVPRSPESTKEDSIPKCTDEISRDTSFDRAFLCPRADSLNKLFEQLRGENHRMRVKITVEKVDGELILRPPPRIIIISLFLQNTNVTQISAETENQSVLSSLTVLILRETPVTEQALTSLLLHLPALQHLDISSSGLSSLPEKVFDKNPELQFLDLSNNAFGKIALPRNLILRLMHLNISSCQLDKVSVLTACMERPCSMPSPQGRLRTLDVSNNYLKWLPRRLVKSLKNDSFVNIKGNRWNETCDCSLYYLWQYSRQALYIDASEELDCFNETVLRSCSWDDCPDECDCDSETKTVNCTGKGLAELPIVVPSETEIFLADNNVITNIDNVAFPTYCNLRSLSVERNLMTELLLSRRGKCVCDTDFYIKDSNCFPQHLRTMSLDDNKIRGLTTADCLLLHPLTTLTMSRNKVRCVFTSAKEVMFLTALVCWLVCLLAA
ncbi:protein slit-like [Penaeus indicus]|uniref:protein slit-like n=1 Tax=Penaeus indicus TaxID=29960 RepID=UPI00300D2D02